LTGEEDFEGVEAGNWEQWGGRGFWPSAGHHLKIRKKEPDRNRRGWFVEEGKLVRVRRWRGQGD